MKHAHKPLAVVTLCDKGAAESSLFRWCKALFIYLFILGQILYRKKLIGVMTLGYELVAKALNISALTQALGWNFKRLLSLQPT